jgi:hypothetical protein
MRWAGHVAHVGEGSKVYRVWWESQKERDHLEDQGVDGRMGSEWILGRLAGGIEWIQLARDRASGGLVNTMVNLRVLASRSWLVSYGINITASRLS